MSTDEMFSTDNATVVVSADNPIDKEAVKKAMKDSILRNEIINRMHYTEEQGYAPFASTEADKDKIISDITFEEVASVYMRDEISSSMVNAYTMGDIPQSLKSLAGVFEDAEASDFAKNNSILAVVAMLCIVWAKRMGFYDVFDEALVEVKTAQQAVATNIEDEISQELDIDMGGAE